MNLVRLFVYLLIYCSFLSCGAWTCPAHAFCRSETCERPVPLQITLSPSWEQGGWPEWRAGGRLEVTSWSVEAGRCRSLGLEMPAALARPGRARPPEGPPGCWGGRPGVSTALSRPGALPQDLAGVRVPRSTDVAWPVCQDVGRTGRPQSHTEPLAQLSGHRAQPCLGDEMETS